MNDRDLLNSDIDEITTELDNQLWSWLNMGDNRVCDDCERLSKLQPMTLTEWQTNHTEPGRGDTICGDHCRCLFFPEGLLQIFPDLKTGGKIIIPDSGALMVDLKTPYELFADLDELIGEYKAVTGGRKLPSEYYELDSVDKRIKFLIDYLK
jgi:hypothetical protein